MISDANFIHVKNIVSRKTKLLTDYKIAVLKTQKSQYILIFRIVWQKVKYVSVGAFQYDI